MASAMEIIGPVTWARPLAVTLAGLVKIVERDSFIQKFGFINGVDNVNWPPYRDSKS